MGKKRMGFKGPLQTSRPADKGQAPPAATTEALAEEEGRQQQQLLRHKHQSTPPNSTLGTTTSAAAEEEAHAHLESSPPKGCGIIIGLPKVTKAVGKKRAPPTTSVQPRSRPREKTNNHQKAGTQNKREEEAAAPAPAPAAASKEPVCGGLILEWVDSQKWFTDGQRELLRHNLGGLAKSDVHDLEGGIRKITEAELELIASKTELGSKLVGLVLDLINPLGRET